MTIEKVNHYIISWEGIARVSRAMPQERRSLASLKPGEALVFPVCPGKHYQHKNADGSTQSVCPFLQKVRKWAYSIRDHQDFTFFIEGMHHEGKLIVFRPK